MGARRWVPRPPEPLRESLRATAKETIWLAVRHRPGPKPTIGLFCSRRGGSTWVMEIIAANRGILPLNQPLEILTPNLTPYQYRRLPKFDQGQIVRPDEQQERELRAYVDDLLAGRIRVNAPFAFWRRGFQWRTERLLLKITGAKTMMDWFTEHYGLDVIYQVRHPIPTGLSCIRNGWGTATAAYLRNEWFVEEVVGDPALRSWALALDRDGTALERQVLTWTIENLYPMRVVGERPRWLSLSYEECVVDRDAVLRRVADGLDLTDLHRMHGAAGRPSRSSALSTDDARDAMRAQDTSELLSSWQSQVDAGDVADVDRILDRFGIALYRGGSPLPDWGAQLGRAS